MITGMLYGLFDVLPGALLHPQQPRYAPVFGFAGATFRVLVAQQFGQFFFGVVFTVGLGANNQVAPFALEKAFGEAPNTVVVLEIQLNGGRCGGVTPRAKIVYGR